MKAKECKKCLTEKEFHFFGKCKKGDKNGLDAYCKNCRSLMATERGRTKRGLVFKIYNQQKNSSKKRNHQLPTYSRDDLLEWLISQQKFHVLYDNWKRLDYQKDYIPSIDRKDDDIGYTMANIKLVTWKQNNEKGHESRRKALSKQGERNVQIILLSDTDETLEEFYSLSDAERSTGISKYFIKGSCNKEISLNNGTKFKYKKDT